MLPLLLAVACYVLALFQRPGLAVTDTKIDLHVDPVRFLADAAAPWSSSISLGHVQSGQYGGYVFPMGPFFAVLRELGLSPWLIERLWLGTLWALAAWGIVRLVDALHRRERGVAHVVAAGIFVLNPYVVTYTSRVSVSLLAYAALPWLLVIVHRGLRDGRGRRWVWPGAFALVVTASGGGINAAVTAWALVGPLMLLLYEPLMGMVSWATVRRFVWRTVVLGAITSLWWVVPLLVQSKWGMPFLPYTEQSGTIWNTTSITESLRLMGFWLSYVGVGYGGKLTPYTSDAGVMLFSVPVLIATLLVPALALAGFVWTRRWRYGPLFLAMVLAGLLVMVVGFPEGTPLRHGITFAFNRLVSLQFLRTTYKAGPLVALGLAMLGGAAAAPAWAWLVARRRVVGRVAFAGATVVLLALAAWPLVRGRGVDDQLTWKRIPPAWTQVASDVDATVGDDHRAMVLPGQLFSAYTWGETVDPILPTLATKPVAVRQVVPFADLRSVDLQWSTDALVNQRRGLPGQLPQMLSLQGVSSVVTGSDDDRARSGALGANAAASELVRQGLATPVAAYGPRRTVGAQAGDVAAPVRLPEVRRYAVRSAPMVRLLPAASATVVDGASGGVLGLAAFGTLPSDEPIRYAADLSPSQIRGVAASGGRIVVSDSNRRQVFVPSRLRGNLGATLAPADPISADGHQLDPWPSEGTDAQTVAQLRGVAYVRAPFSPQVTQFPEHRPFAALDGNPSTAWLADRTLAKGQWHLDVGFTAPRAVDHVDLLPYGDARGRVTAVTVNGRRFAVHPGWNHLVLGLRHVSALRVAMAGVTRPANARSTGAGGISELRIPGVTATEALRPPVLAEDALRGADVRRADLTYLFERQTGDDPFHRGTVHGAWQAGDLRDQGDAETGLSRALEPPAARTWNAAAWVTVTPSASDAAIDRLAGLGAGAPLLTSSSRYEGVPGWRASSAFDGEQKTAWLGGWIARAPATDDASALAAAARQGRGASISWTGARAATVHRLTLGTPRAVVRRPTKVRLAADGVLGATVPVGAGGVVTLPAPVRGTRFTLYVVDAAFPPGTSGVDRRRRAVGIADIAGAGVPRVAPPRTGAVRALCEARFTVGGKVVRLRPVGTVADLDAGHPLRAEPCDGPVALAAGAQSLTAPAGALLTIDDLELDSPAAAASSAASPSAAGRIISAGTPGEGKRDDIKVDVTKPAWLVLGESYSAGWRATCDGTSLGAPVPLEGYSAAWLLPPGCRTVDVVFAGNAPVYTSGLISLIASLALLVIVVVGLRRRRYRPLADTTLLPADAPLRMPLRRALAWGIGAALVGGFVFALRAGVVIGPAVAVILWRGIGARTLALAAGALLAVVVPVLYVVFPAADKGGYNGNYPIAHLSAHWAGVGGVVLLWLALYRALAAAGVGGRVRRPRSRTPKAAAH